jgi:Kef-type K+ transport system membrane component KefB
MYPVEPVIYVFFLIFTGTALLSTLALFTRQSLLVAYIVLGAILGPWGLKLINDTSIIKETGNVGILFLLFLLGLHLHPQNLLHSLRKMSWVTFISSLIFLTVGILIGLGAGLGLRDSMIIGVSVMFSSTIIGLKLLPTTILHHQYTGELVISILLLQDLIAIVALLVIQGMSLNSLSFHTLGLLISGFPVLLLVAFVFERYILTPLLYRFDRIQEYIFILSIGWCLLMTVLSETFGLPDEIGAFIAGVALATNPISLYIAENLKPLRDFFLVMFFFTIGASFDFTYVSTVIVPATALAAAMLLIKPLVFSRLLRHSGEPPKESWEIGVRLGQTSEFSLLIIALATTEKLIQPATTNIVIAATIITFIVSCYWVTMRYPTPLASSDKLRKD